MLRWIVVYIQISQFLVVYELCKILPFFEQNIAIFSCMSVKKPTSIFIKFLWNFSISWVNFLSLHIVLFYWMCVYAADAKLKTSTCKNDHIT